MAELFSQPAPSLIGRYEVVESIGSGGMAAVYRAWARGPTGAGRPVAIKLIHQHLAGQPQFVEMFFEETRVALALTHRNIVQTFDAGEIAGRPYLVMELVEGCSLVELIGRSEQDVPLELALFIVCEVCAALSYAHTFRPEREGQPHAVVHRDVSPSNVLLSWAGDVKLADFGVARATDAARAGQSGIKGKLSYMPPEQARGDAEPRSDLFALGVVLYELIARKPLSSRPMNALQALERREIEPLHRLRPEISPSLEAIIERCIEPDPRDRPSSADELGGVLWAEIDRIQRAAGGGDLRARLSAYVAALPGPPRNETVGRVAQALMAEIAELSAVDARALATASDLGGAPGAGGAPPRISGTAIVVLGDDDDLDASQPMVERTVPDARVRRAPVRLGDDSIEPLDEDDQIGLDTLDDGIDDSENDATVIAAASDAERRIARALKARAHQLPPTPPADDHVVGSGDEAPTKIRREYTGASAGPPPTPAGGLGRIPTDEDTDDLASTRIRRLDEIDLDDIAALDADVDMDNARTIDAPPGALRGVRTGPVGFDVPVASVRRGETVDISSGSGGKPPGKPPGAPPAAPPRRRASRVERPEPTQSVKPPRYNTEQRRTKQRRLGWIVIGSVALVLVIIASWLGWRSGDTSIPHVAPKHSVGGSKIDSRVPRTADLE
ncbi:MAG: serine/threonine protein kinase [Myxococcales bacterium]|nr:serine/threonine protein kinase [Myxococcales bacterium]